MAIPKRTKKLFVILILLIVLVAVLFLRFSSKIKEEQWKKAEDTAKQKTIEYIEDKYGFKAEVKSIMVHHDGSIFDEPKTRTPTGSALVELEHEGKRFSVMINYKNNIGYDDYQFDEIKQAFEDRLNSEIPGGEVVNLSLDGQNYSASKSENVSASVNMLSKDAYYDGSNLMNIINKSTVTMSAVYTDTKFKDCKLFEDIKANEESSLSLVSFKTDDIKEEFKKNYHDYYIDIYNDQRDFYFYAPYINDRWQVKKSKSEHLEPLHLFDCGDFLVYADPFDKDEKITAVETDLKAAVDEHNKKVAELNEKDGYTRFDNYKPITKGYRLESEGGFSVFLFVFYPMDKLDFNENHDVMAFENDGLTNTYKCGDYMVLSTSHETDFCFIEAYPVDTKSSTK